MTDSLLSIGANGTRSHAVVPMAQLDDGKQQCQGSCRRLNQTGPVRSTEKA